MNIGANGFKRNDYEWRENEDGSVTITGYTGNGGDVVIPSEIDGKSVKSIGGWVFEDCKRLTSITIPDSVAKIGYGTFFGCKGLTSITIPDSVTSIGNEAFRNCTGLTSIIIPDSVTSIGNEAFYGCTRLTSITISDSVTEIGSYAFFGCKGLTVINVGENNESYTSEDGVLFDKNKTTLITYPGGKKGAYTIPYGVKSISDAFAGCTRLTNVTIPDSVTSIGNSAFYGCTRLTSITIPNSVAKIGISTFFDCKRLTSITIPDSVTEIGSYAFSDCTGLTSVMIPDNVIEIGIYVFSGCTGLKVISVDKSNKNYTSEDGVLFNKNKTALITYPGGKKGAYTVPYGVTEIGDFAFEDCTGLTNVIIPDSVTSISVSAFSDCKGLTGINVDKSNKSYSSKDGVLFNKNKTALITYPGGKKGAYTIPNSVTLIGNEAFSDCKRLTSVTIPDSVTSIGNLAFSDCKRLTNVIIPDSVVNISEYSFCRCKKITIKGHEESYAETYCKIHNLKFKKLVERNRRNLINNK